jgi:hypothetical protein
MKMKWGEAGGCGRLRQAAATALWLGEHGLRTSRAGKRLHRQRHGLDAACCTAAEARWWRSGSSVRGIAKSTPPLKGNSQ